MTLLTQPFSPDERSRIEEAQWNPNAIKVWPLGPQGPCLTLRELAAWRAERERMRDMLDQEGGREQD